MGFRMASTPFRWSLQCKSRSIDCIFDGNTKVEHEKYANILEAGMTGEMMKLLNLACDWVQTLLPHALSKINRVSFGILTPADLAVADPRMPQSSCYGGAICWQRRTEPFLRICTS